MKNFELVEKRRKREVLGNTAEKCVKITTTHVWRYRATGDILHEVQTVFRSPRWNSFNHYWTMNNGGTANLAYWLREIKKRAQRPY